MTMKNKPTEAPGTSTAAGSSPVARTDSHPPASRGSDKDVAEFLAKLRTLPPQKAGVRGRLVFGMDATMKIGRAHV